MDALLEEAAVKAFDEDTSDSSNFTAPGSLGPEAGESYPLFNDVDDFNNFSQTGTALNGMTYTMTAEVGYVNPSDSETITAHRTFQKRMNVTLSSDYLKSDISLSRIFSYIR
jgi:hypothetical protein